MNQFDNVIDQTKNDLLETTQEILKIKSVKEAPETNMPFGRGIDACLNFSLDKAKEFGFRTKNVDHYAGFAEIGEGKEMLGVLVHLDVVPEGRDWDFDPFGGEISNGKIYGRGAIDNKGPAVAVLYAMKAIHDSGLPISKRIRLIFGTDEESGSACMDYYRRHEESPTLAFSPDADFPAIYGEMGIMVFDFVADFSESLKDGGIRVTSITGGERPNMVPDYAEARLENFSAVDVILNAYNLEFGSNISLEVFEDGKTAIVHANGISAHGSTPWKGRNAISDLLGFLNCLDLEIGDLTNFIRFYAAHIGYDLYGERIGCALEDSASGKLVFNVGVIALDTEGVHLTVNTRYPITENVDNVLGGINEVIAFWKIGLNLNEHLDPLYIPKNHPLVSTLMQVYQTYTGDFSDPITIGGGTYARAFKNAVAFGPFFPGTEESAHQKNEFYGVDDLILITKIFASAMYELAK